MEEYAYSIFVVISTIIFFVVLKMYKNKVLIDRKLKQKRSNLIFLLFVPILLYVTPLVLDKFKIVTNNTNIIVPMVKPVSFDGSIISSI